MNFFDFFRSEQPSLVRQGFHDLSTMLETAHDMFAAAGAYLLDNEPLPFDLEQRDQTINQKEQDVRRLVLEHLAINPEAETVLSLTMLSIVQDAERIGDLAKSIAEMADLAKSPRMGDRVAMLAEARDRVDTMFETTRKAFVDGDSQLSRQAMTASREVKDQVRAFTKMLAETEGVTANEAIVLGLAARFIGRTASHLSNIASSVALPFDQIRRNDESI